MILYRHKNVLVIDDSIIDNLISSKILQNSNYAENVIINDSPKDALKYIHDAVRNQKNIPEVIFLDIRMPEMNGFDFLDQFEKIEGIKDHHIKVYILSSSLDPNDFKRFEAYQAVLKFIGKPVSEEALESI